MKKVSVIIPVYNAEEFIFQSVNSILNQTYKNLEIIIVNDGSTDNSLQVLFENYSDNKQVKIISTENQGQSAACNLGFYHSTGELIKFFDADDILNEIFIEEQVMLLGDNVKNICSSKWGRFYFNDISTFQLNPEVVWCHLDSIDWITNSLVTGSNMLQCAIWLIPRELLNTTGLWNVELSLNNDFEFFIRVLLASEQVLFSSKSVLYYRSGNNNSLSQIINRRAYVSGVNSNLMGCSYIIKHTNNWKTRDACIRNLIPWMINTYIEHPDLSSEIENEISKINRKRILYVGSKYASFLSYFIGWKLVARLSNLKRKTFKY